MSLRHRFATTALPDFRAESEPVNPPAVLKRPHVVEFRPETDLDKVCGEISRYARVTLSAAPGAGKSTRVPIKLAEVLSIPVLLAVPSEHLADQHFVFLSRRSPGDYAVALEEGDQVAKQGVTITSYAWLCGKILQCKGQGGDYKPFGDCAIFADEVHESDAFSEFVRRLGTSIPGVKHFVSASATHDAARMPKMELKGSSETKFFSRKDQPGTWNPADLNKPWSVSCLDGNALMFLDDEKVATEMVRQYSMLGVTAVRMHSRMSRDSCKAAFDMMRNPNAGVMVMVADYSFRNGFTYDITRIIDSALVRVLAVEDGELKRSLRTVYEIEKYQTMARGSRTEGSVCEYYMPESMTFKSAICSLEAVEAEAAAAMYRAYGYAVPADIRACVKMDSSKIPKNLHRAFTGFVPLAMLSDDDLVDLVVKLEVNTEVADVLASYGIDDSPVETTEDLFEGLDVTLPIESSVPAATNLLAQLQEISSSAKTLTPGVYYSCVAARANGSTSYASWKSLLESIHGNPLAVTGYSALMRSDAVNRLLLQYNLLVVEQSAAGRVSSQKDALTAITKRFPEESNAWAGWMAATLLEASTMSVSLLKAIDKLRTPTMVFVPVEPDVDLEEKKAREMVAPLRRAVAGATCPVDKNSFFAQISGEMGYDPGPDFPSVERPVVDFLEDGHTKCELRWKSVKVGRSVMHDVYFVPDDPMHWEFDAYVSAIQTIVVQKGVVPEAIRKLTIRAPSIDSNKVMQAVRDSMSSGRRIKTYTVERKLLGAGK